MPDQWGGLPPSIYQGIGWGPAADPTMQPPVPAPPGGPQDWGGLPPSIPQGMGWAPPPDAAPMAPALPPTPTGLPSMEGSAPGQQPTPRARDYPVSPSAFGAGIKPPSPNAPTKPGAAPARPQSFGQGMANLQQREAQTEQAQTEAIGAGVEAQKGLHAEQLGAFDRARQSVEANAAERKAEDDSWKKIYATNQAKAEADRKSIDGWKFNRNKYMDELGVGGKVRWGIGMILAGIGQGMMRQGGPNPVTEMLQQNIHDANAAQYKERDGLVEKLGFDRQTGQDAQQYHATRQADLDKRDGLAYTALGKQLEEAAVKTADPIARANGLKEAANVRAMGDERLKSYIQLQSEHEHQQGQLAIAGGELALNRKKFDWEKDKDQQQLDINAAKLLTTKQGKLDEEQAKRAIYIPSPDGSGQLIVARKQDGTPVLAGSADIAAKDQNMVAAASSYNRLVGQMVRGIKDHGGESTWIKGDEWQKMMTDLQSATAELHDAYGITAFREPTVQFFEKMATAGVDPTSFVRDTSAALEHSNQNLQAKVNERVSARGYDGPQFGWRDTTNPTPPADTQDDKLFKLAAGSRGDDPGAVYNPKTGAFDPRITGSYSVDPDAPPTAPAPSSQDRRIASEYPRMGAGQKAALDSFAAMARSGDAALQRRGLQHLEDLARPGNKGKANEDGVRGYAQELLNNMVQPPEPTEQTTGASGRGYSQTGASRVAQPPVVVNPAAWSQMIKGR